MKRLSIITLLALTISSIISCTTQTGIDGDGFIRSSTGIHFGTSEDLYSFIEDSTFTEISYSITGLSETKTESENTLNIDVEHAGGEGNCPALKFFVQWDGSFEQTDTTKVASVGLAGFLVNSNVTCEALVRETLEYDLNTLFEDDLSDITQINVVNLYTNMVDSLVRGE